MFALSNGLALIGWVALVLAPFRRALAVTTARLVAATLCGAYLAFLIHGLTVGPPPPAEASFTTLSGVAALLSTRQALLAGWVHYLAFDLFVGSWQTADAPKAHIPHWLLLPCLALTFVAGPVGLLLYLILKAVRQPR